jgi:hypothetical protein
MDGAMEATMEMAMEATMERIRTDDAKDARDVTRLEHLAS